MRLKGSKTKDASCFELKGGYKKPCKACAEIFCMGICADQVKYREEYIKKCDKIRQQIKQQRRGERDRKGTSSERRKKDIS